MAYPNYYYPYPQQQQSGQGLIWVQGENGAKSYLVAPSQSVLLMDSEQSCFYIKSADASGMPQPLRVFDYKERKAIERPQSDFIQTTDKYVTREEYEALKGKYDDLEAKINELKKVGDDDE